MKEKILAEFDKVAAQMTIEIIAVCVVGFLVGIVALYMISKNNR